MGCYQCAQADGSIKVSNYSSKVIKHGPGCLMFLPCAEVTKIYKITLSAEQYLKITYLVPQDTKDKDNDIIEHIAGPAIYKQDDPFSLVEGPYNKTELSASQYIIVTNPKNGLKYVVEGPQMYMPKPYESLSKVSNKISLLNNNYVKITDILTGNLQIVSGPTIFTPTPYESVGKIMRKYELTSTEYIICTDGKTGNKVIREGPMLYIPTAFEEVSEELAKISLSNDQYVYIKDCISGKVSIVEGPKLFALTPFEESSKIMDCLSLTFSHYVFIKNIITGVIRVDKGPSKVVLSPIEEYVLEDNKATRNALTADVNSAIHIRDIVTGVETLITEAKIFFPETPNIKILGLRPLIKLAPYERMVIIDRESNLIFRSGEKSKGFFLPPFCKALTQNWTYGLQNEKKKIEVFDARFHDMDFKFSVRTNDNVEILMKVNIYWTIKQFEKMIKSTNDPPQDLCNHIRSQILNISSKLSTKELMEFSSVELVKEILDEDDEFCQQRGVAIVRINITEKKCADPEVEKTYLQVIEEKINRIRTLEAQRGENDKKIAEIEGQIVFESENFKLLEKKMANIQMENETNGKAEGERIHMFFDGLGKDLDNIRKMNIFMEIQRTDRIKLVSNKIDKLYVSPDDVDLIIDTADNGASNKK
jgi:regulator of protease activity HflC (stomatin/prohibitin superfamily)